MKTKLIEFYLDYLNNYLTVAKIAEHNEIPEEAAVELISIGKELHEREVERLKERKIKLTKFKQAEKLKLKRIK